MNASQAIGLLATASLGGPATTLHVAIEQSMLLLAGAYGPLFDPPPNIVLA